MNSSRYSQVEKAVVPLERASVKISVNVMNVLISRTVKSLNRSDTICDMELFVVVIGGDTEIHSDIHYVIPFDHQIRAESWLESHRGEHEWINLYGPCRMGEDVTDAPLIAMTHDGNVTMWRGEKI